MHQDNQLQSISPEPGLWTSTLPAAMRHVVAATDAVLANVAILDHSGNIVAVNEAWHRFAQDNGYAHPRAGLGLNYLQICEQVTGEQEAEARAVAEAIRHLLGGPDTEFALQYACHTPTVQRWFRLRIRALEAAGQRYVVIAHDNLTDLRRAEQRMREQADQIAYLSHLLSAASARGRTLATGDGHYLRKAQDRLATLTARERQIFDMVVSGLANKQIARRLNLTDKTIEFHRARIMRKMQASSLAELVRMAVIIEPHGAAIDNSGNP